MTDDIDRSSLAQIVEQLAPEQRRRLFTLARERVGAGGEVSNSRGLAAYVSLNEERDENAHKAVLAFLKARLPDYMVPTRLVVVDELPKLPNGKVDRARLEMDLEGNADAASIEEGRGDRFELPRTKTEKDLAEVWMGVLDSDKISRTDHFFELGGDSILSIQVVSRTRLAGLPMEATDLFEFPVLTELASVLEARSAEVSESTIGEQEGTADPENISLTPIQHWFFETVQTDRSQWNQLLCFEADRSVARQILVEALRQLPSNHESLRLRFRESEDGWTARMADDCSWFVDTVENAYDDDTETISDRLLEYQSRFDLESGPLAAGTLFDRGPDKPYLIVILVHHLLVDYASSGIIADRLSKHLRAPNQVNVPKVDSPSFLDWIHALERYSRSSDLLAEKDYWLATNALIEPLEWDPQTVHPVAFGTEASTKMQLQTFSRETTERLLGANRPYKTLTEELLLAALWMSLAELFPGRPIAIGVESHGRNMIEGVDPSTLAGWMTAYYPLCFSQDGPAGLEAAIVETKERLRAVPKGGIGYGILRYLAESRNDAPERTVSWASPEISFNYLGVIGHGRRGLVRASVTGKQPDGLRSGNCERHCVLEINTLVIDGRLETQWKYQTQIEEQVASFIAKFERHLTELVHHCLEKESTRSTPSDFPEAGLTQNELDRLFDDLN